MKEIWKDVIGFEGYYQVSNTGMVKSLARFYFTKTGKAIQIKEKVLKGHKDTKGYLQVELRNGKGRNIKMIHRLVAEAFVSNSDGKEQVNHKDGNKENNSADNLEWVTCQENIRHAWRNGLNRARYGEEHPNHKVDMAAVKDIRDNYSPNKDGFRAKDFAKKYGISSTHVLAIFNRRVWNYASAEN